MDDGQLRDLCQVDPRDTASASAAGAIASLRQVRALLARCPPPQRLPAILALGPGTAPRWVILDHSPLTIGRDPGNDVVLDEAGVSRRHCRLVTVEGAWLLEDCGARNGVVHRGEKISRLGLCSGDVLTLGSACLLFVDEHQEAAAPCH